MTKKRKKSPQNRDDSFSTISGNFNIKFTKDVVTKIFLLATLIGWFLIK